jgi:hypothetical protein|nr:MAG TPA: hypothetical protein [Caudoviricetes sp.]
MGQTLSQKLMHAASLDWSVPEVHVKSQELLRKVKWLRGADLDKNGDIESYELERCMNEMTKRWSAYPDRLFALNNGDDTFSWFLSFIDDACLDGKVIGTVTGKSFCEVYGKGVLLVFASIKAGTVATRDERREARKLEAKERELTDVQKRLRRRKKKKGVA